MRYWFEDEEIQKLKPVRRRNLGGPGSQAIESRYPSDAAGYVGCGVCPHCGMANVLAGECLACGWNTEDAWAQELAAAQPLELKGRAGP